MSLSTLGETQDFHDFISAYRQQFPDDVLTISDMLDFFEDELYDSECNLHLHHAMRFMMENRTVIGDEAVALGMAGEAVDADRFTERLAEYCEELCQWSPITLRLLKRGMTKSLETLDLEQQLRYELTNIRMAFGGDDGKEARKAFFEKRKPNFTGR